MSYIKKIFLWYDPKIVKTHKTKMVDVSCGSLTSNLLIDFLKSYLPSWMILDCLSGKLLLTRPRAKHREEEENQKAAKKASKGLGRGLGGCLALPEGTADLTNSSRFAHFLGNVYWAPIMYLGLGGTGCAVICLAVTQFLRQLCILVKRKVLKWCCLHSVLEVVVRKRRLRGGRWRQWSRSASLRSGY